MTTEVWIAAPLLLFASLYFGMGFSLVALQFPGALEITSAQNFPDRFGRPVRRGVAFFTVVSVLMIAGGCWLTALEWDHDVRRLLPLAFTALVVVATVGTVFTILPVNQKLFSEISDPVVFKSLLSTWIRWNTIRYAFWVLEWCCIAGWFVWVSGG